MSYTVEEKTIGRFTVRVVADDDYRLEYAVNDEPVMIFGDGRHEWEVLDQSKRNFPSYAFLKQWESDDAESCLDEWADSHSWNGWEWLDSGWLMIENPDWPRPRYFKTAENALRAIMIEEHGAADLVVQQFGNYRSTFYLCFWQSELDKYAGNKNAESCLADCQSIVDGDVYGFEIEDSDGDVIESCWGFIGDSDYCLNEAIGIAQHMESEATERDAIAFAESVESSRPDMHMT